MSAAVDPGPVLAAESDDENEKPLHGRALVDAARAVGATWVVDRAEKSVESVRPTVIAAAGAGLGVLLRLSDTRLIGDLEGLVAPLGGGSSVAELRERLLVVVDSERTGKRLRSDATWAPSAVDVGELGFGFLRLMRRAAPNFVRSACLTDDVLAPADLFPARRVPAVAARLRSRGGRLWLTGVAQDRLQALRSLPVHGLVLSLGA